VAKPDPEHENETITISYKAGHSVKPFIPAFSFEKPQNYIFTTENKGSLPFRRSLSISGVSDKLEEGNEIEVAETVGTGILKVEAFRADIVVSKGSVELKDNIASQTEILFSTPGYIEITQGAAAALFMQSIREIFQRNHRRLAFRADE